MAGKNKGREKSSLLIENAIFYSMQTESQMEHHCYTFYVVALWSYCV